MKNVSIFNDVIGPVMRGPSSSHTAGSHHLSRLAAALLGERPVRAAFAFDPAGSYAKCYASQGSDLAFVGALLGWALTDDRFPRALADAPDLGLDATFRVVPLPGADHPNYVRIELAGERGAELSVVGKSVGGGAIEAIEVAGWPVCLDGSCHEILIECLPGAEAAAAALAAADQALGPPEFRTQHGLTLALLRRRSALPAAELAALRAQHGVKRVWHGTPLSFVKRGTQAFDSSAGILKEAKRRGASLGAVATAYEAELLGLSEADILAEAERRVDIMVASVHAGLRTDAAPMQLLSPTARGICDADAAGKLPTGGMHTRAAARAMAAMNVNCTMGVVCAAPTAGSAGVLPGVVATLLEERGVPRADLARGLLAAGAVGVVVAERATFAAEVAGCQVEIGAAGALAAALIVEVYGGAAGPACDAAAISFQNTMGMVCDLVQGIVEIPCHTRNAVAAATAFVTADLVVGGYYNPIPLDDTVDAVYLVGLAMPADLRVTSLGGLAATPSAKALRPRRLAQVVQIGARS